MYKGAVRKRNRAGTDDGEDIAARLQELSCGHGGRTPMPEIELLERVHSSTLVMGTEDQKKEEEYTQTRCSLSEEDGSSTGPPSVDSLDEVPSVQKTP